MTDGDWKPRENDPLVEPMFAAVREPDHGEVGAPPRRWRARWVVPAALAVAALVTALLLWLVLSPGACAPSSPPAPHGAEGKLAA